MPFIKLRKFSSILSLLIFFFVFAFFNHGNHECVLKCVEILFQYMLRTYVFVLYCVDVVGFIDCEFNFTLLDLSSWTRN